MTFVRRWPSEHELVGLFGLGWVVALILLPPVTAAEVDPVVARVNQHEIHLSEVQASIESLALSDQIDVRADLSGYIEAMIREEVLFQLVLATNFEGESELRAKIRELVAGQLLRKHVTSHSVSDDEVRAFYDANPSQVRGEHTRVLEMLLASRKACEEMQQRVDSDETFMALARKHSLDRESAAAGGDAGLMMRPEEGRGGGRELEYFDMRPGEMRIFDVPQGCLLVRQLLYVNPPLPPFENVKENIRRYLGQAKQAKLLEALFEEAFEQVTVERLYQLSP